jgi:hypothetical protein
MIWLATSLAHRANSTEANRSAAMRRSRPLPSLAALVSFLGILLPSLSAQGRDPLWVLLSNNAGIELPRFETGANYVAEPAATSPAERSAEVRASARAGGLGHLQDGDRPNSPDAGGLGWNGPKATITFNLQRSYRIEAVELLLEERGCPDTIEVECRSATLDEWRAAGGLALHASTGSFWQLIPLRAPQEAAEIRIAFNRKGGPIQVREVRIWGRLDEADLARLPAIPGGQGDELALVSGGEARSVIVVGARPALKTTAAARLLQDMLFRMTGAKLPVVERANRTDVARLLVGPGAAVESGVKVPQTYPENEHFVLRRIGRDVVIAGNDASPDPASDPDSLVPLRRAAGRGGQEPASFHGTLTAVCAFLELQGARFYRWDDVAKYLITPHRTDIQVGILDQTERPAFMRRSISARPQTYTPARELWRVWNRIGGVHMAYSHNDIVSPGLYRTHPEYFSLIKGQRVEPGPRVPWQVCTSNPAVIRIACELAADQFQESPGLRSFSLSARDNLGFCECPACRAQAGNASDRWVLFANAVRAEFDRCHPEFADRKFVFYAYWALSAPPTQVKIAPGVQAMFIGDGCHAHAWQSAQETCSNQKMLEKLQGWKAASPSEPVLIYDWYIPATGSGTNSLQWQNFPWFVSTKPFVDARFWQQQGTPVVNVEIDGIFDKLALHWLPYYMVSRAAWDPSLSPDKLLNDLCGALYADAAATMAATFRLLERSLTEADVHGRTWRLPDPHAIYPAARREEISQHLTRALQQTQGDALARARIMDVKVRWDDGWTALARLKLPAQDVELYNPAVGK